MAGTQGTPFSAAADPKVPPPPPQERKAVQANTSGQERVSKGQKECWASIAAAPPPRRGGGEKKMRE